MKNVIIILSDPKSGGDEALGRLFNALILAQAGIEAGDEVEIVFQGAGTRWPEELVKVSHPANALYNAVRPVVKGASCGCAEVFGAEKGLQQSGTPLLREHSLPGTSGVTDLRSYLARGWSPLVF